MLALPPFASTDAAKSLGICHCERSEAIPTVQERASGIASSLTLLAMTGLLDGTRASKMLVVPPFCQDTDVHW
jgi:hypothetical protein